MLSYQYNNKGALLHQASKTDLKELALCLSIDVCGTKKTLLHRIMTIMGLIDQSSSSSSRTIQCLQELIGTGTLMDSETVHMHIRKMRKKNKPPFCSKDNLIANNDEAQKNMKTYLSQLKAYLTKQPIVILKNMLWSMRGCWHPNTTNIYIFIHAIMSIERERLLYIKERKTPHLSMVKYWMHK